jgi:lauroyl/myristoyl acyltransferase
VPIGAARIATDTGAALVAVFCPRDGDRYRFLVEEVPLQRTGHPAADLDANLATLVVILERAIRAWPDQWVTFERFWPVE